MDIKVAEDLWASSMLPEGIVERWFFSDGALVASGVPIAEVRIEDAVHEVLAPMRGRLFIQTAENAVIEPGSVLGQVEPLLDKAA